MYKVIKSWGGEVVEEMEFLHIVDAISEAYDWGLHHPEYDGTAVAKVFDGIVQVGECNVGGYVDLHPKPESPIAVLRRGLSDVLKLLNEGQMGGRGPDHLSVKAAWEVAGEALRKADVMLGVGEVNDD